MQLVPLSRQLIYASLLTGHCGASGIALGYAQGPPINPAATAVEA